MTEEIKPFNQLQVSTQTSLSYMNCSFNIPNIYAKLPVIDIGNQDVKSVNGKHGVIYRSSKKKGNFRNQMPVSIFIIDKIITVKIFRTGKFHLTGCKNSNHQQQCTIELLKHILNINTQEEPTIKIEDNQPLNAVLDVTMVNIDYKLGFDISLKKLDQVLQSESTDFYTSFESPVNTSVIIKLSYPEPLVKSFDRITFKGDSVIIDKTSECPKAKQVSSRTHTFLVFSSSKVIQSGRYYESEMEPAYKLFNEFIKKNREHIELIFHNDKFDIKQLNGLNNIELKATKSKKFMLSKTDGKLLTTC
jgi:TATA-box binding protein (TBP) (component of TFIID and TFIIIB)